MDGTGKLFSALLSYLDRDAVKIISLPGSGPQNYERLKEYVKTELPSGEFILVAESFSGPIAVSLANEGYKGLKALVLVATFLSPPNKLFLRLAQMMPIKVLMRLPLSAVFLRTFMLGRDVSNSEISIFRDVVDEVPDNILKQRLQAMCSLSMPRESSSISSVYIRPILDRLVPSRKILEISRCLKGLEEKTVNGPHFILQANPHECAVIINYMVQSFDKSLKNDARSTETF